MWEFVSFLIPRRRACDTIADAASAQGRFHPAASQTPRDLVQFCLACRPPSASEIGLSRAFSRTPTARSYPRKEPSNDCAANSKIERGGRSRDRTRVDRAPDHTGRSISARPRRPTTAPNSPLIYRVHHKYSAEKKVRSSDAYCHLRWRRAELVRRTTPRQKRGPWGLRALGFTGLQVSKEE